MYGGLSVTFFFLVLFLQQVAGYDALEAGIATIPTTLVMFTLSRRAGRLADRFGPRFFMGFGPLVSAVGIALMLRLDEDISYWTELFPALLVFSLGLVATVTPLTATVLADADEHNAGIASGVNNAIARVAGLLCVAAIGAVVSAVYANDMAGLAVGDTLQVIPGMPQSVAASVHAFHVGIGVCAALVGLGGVLGLVGIRNPRRQVRCEDCAEGAHSVQAPHSPLSREPAAAAS
jgi:MFS family permease